MLLDNYPIIDTALSLLLNEKFSDDAMNTLFLRLAKEYDLSHIAVLECNDSEQIVRCSYEWSKDQLLTLLFTEHRYFNDQDYNDWCKDIINADDYITIVNGDQKDYEHVLRNDCFGTIIRFPMILNSQLIGSVDFYSEEYEVYWPEEAINAFRQATWIVSSYIMHLISTRKAITEEQTSSLEYDSITHLPKYEFFYNQLTNYRNSTENSVIVLLCIDFSNLKYLNDRYGYLEGNKFFAKFAVGIYDLADNVIACCRSYSDNFIIACRPSKDDEIEDLKTTIRNNATQLVEKFHAEYFDCNIIINAGIYILKRDSERLDQAISNANLARKYAKSGKPDKGYRCLIYNAGMSIRMKRKAEYITQIDDALANEDLIVELQPRCKADTMEVVGAEALVRWDMHKGYLLYPDEFVSTLEEDGSIIKLDYYVYEKVFEYIYRRSSNNLPIVPISLNVSIIHFYNEDIVPFIRFILKTYPIDPKYISFELNEQIYTSELSFVDSIINELRKLGFNILIDNFGSGYSCLNTFTRHHIDGINLGRVFMKRNLEHNDKVIISGIVNMANRLNIEVLCEGVETEEQREFLLKNGCQYIQGNYFSKSISLDEFSYLLDNHCFK